MQINHYVLTSTEPTIRLLNKRSLRERPGLSAYSAEALGLSLNDLASQVRAAFYGVEAQRIQRGEEEVRIMVRYPEHQRESLGNLESMTIRTADGDEVPFTAVAEIEERMSPATIEREWGKRNINVTAIVDNTITPPGDIVRDVMSGEFQQNHRD